LNADAETTEFVLHVLDFEVPPLQMERLLVVVAHELGNAGAAVKADDVVLLNDVGGALLIDLAEDAEFVLNVVVNVLIAVAADLVVVS